MYGKKRTLYGLCKGSGLSSYILWRTSKGSNGDSYQKSATVVPRGVALRVALRSRIFHVCNASSPCWSSVLATSLIGRRHGRLGEHARDASCIAQPWLHRTEIGGSSTAHLRRASHQPPCAVARRSDSHQSVAQRHTHTTSMISVEHCQLAANAGALRSR